MSLMSAAAAASSSIDAGGGEAAGSDRRCRPEVSRMPCEGGAHDPGTPMPTALRKETRCAPSCELVRKDGHETYIDPGHARSSAGRTHSDCRSRGRGGELGVDRRGDGNAE